MLMADCEQANVNTSQRKGARVCMCVCMRVERERERGTVSLSLKSGLGNFSLVFIV